MQRRTTRIAAFARQAPAFLAALLVLMLASGARAADIAWINPAGGFFGVASNWSTGTVPTGADNVFITLDGTYIVQLDASVEIGALTLGGNSGVQTLDLNSFTLSAPATSVAGGGSLAINGGSLNSPTSYNAPEPLKWTGGKIVGTLNIGPQGRLFIGPGDNTKELIGTINNAGVITWSSTNGDQIRGNGDSATPGGFNNLAGGVFNNISGAERTNQLYGTPLNNAGTVNGLGGTLELQATGGTSGSSTGTFNAAAIGAGISFTANGGGMYTLNAGAQFTGPGVSTFSGATVEVQGASTVVGIVQLTDGSITGGAALSVAPGGQMVWRGGNIKGTVAIAPGGQMNINPSDTFKFLNGNVNNSGTITWSSTNGDQIRGNGDSATPGGLNNLAAGIFNNISGVSRTNQLFGTPLNNAGVVNGLGGTLDIQATGGTSGSSSGTFNASAIGAGIIFTANGGGSHTLRAGARFTGLGVTSFVTGEIEVRGAGSITGVVDLGSSASPDAHITGDSALTVASGGQMNWRSGYIENTVAIARGGRMSILPGTFKYLQGNVNNAGTATWSSTTANDNISGQGTDQTPGGFNNLVGGVFNNAAGFGRVNTFFGAPLNNAGTVNGLSGTLDIQSTGGTSGTSTGTFNAAAGATGARILFSANGGGTHTLSTGARFTGTGLSRIASGEVLVAGATTVSGLLEQAGGDLNGPGSITIANLGTFNLSSGDLALGGALNVALGGKLNWSGGTMSGPDEESVGALNILRGGTFNLLGTNGKALGRRITNAGTTTFAAASALDAFDGLHLAFVNAPGGVLNTARGTTTLSDINLTNSGTINLGGTSIGTLAILGTGGDEGGDFTQTASGILAVQIGGAAITSTDRITVGGRATLSGSVTPSLLGTFAPTTGTRFSFLTAPRRSGAFVRVVGSPLAGGRVVSLAYPEGRVELLISIAPSVSSISPARGPAGTVVTVTGANFSDASRVSLGDTPVLFSRISATAIRFTVPATASSGKITIINAGGSGISVATFIVVPTIKSFTDISGPIATSVLITGANLSGATSVKFNGRDATFTRISAIQIRATVPAGATSGRISVTTPGGIATSAAIFTVIAPSIPRA